MLVDRSDMPPVRLLPDAELARSALSVPLFQQAVRLARWAAPRLAVTAAGELGDEQLVQAAAELGMAADAEAVAAAADAWAFAVDTGLVEIEEDEPAEGRQPAAEGGAAVAVPGWALAQVAGGSPQAVLDVWSGGLEAALADAAIAGLADPLADGRDSGPEEEAAFLEAALEGLYLLAALEELDAQAAGRGRPAAVPLPVLAASLVIPDERQAPTDAVLEEVSEAMMRLDAHFRFLAPTGLLEYQPVDDALIEEEAGGQGGAEAVGEVGSEVGDEELSRYGLVELTPLGVAALRERLVRGGVHAPVIGELAGRDAAAVLEAVARYPQPAASAEAEQWLAGRAPAAAARELLAAARGTGRDAPVRRLACQQMLGRLGAEAEPALREVLDDRELGGLARVWLAEQGAADVPAPDERMVFWLTVDTVAAQLDADDDPELLQDLIRDLAAGHSGFFDQVWRVDHPATAEVLDAMGRLHPDRRTAKLARKAAFKARSAAAG